MYDKHYNIELLDEINHTLKDFDYSFNIEKDLYDNLNSILIDNLIIELPVQLDDTIAHLLAFMNLWNQQRIL